MGVVGRVKYSSGILREQAKSTHALQRWDYMPCEEYHDILANVKSDLIATPIAGSDDPFARCLIV